MKYCLVMVIKFYEIVLCQLEPTEAELPGESVVKLIDPFLLTDGSLTKWLEGVTIQNEMMIHSDQILTIVEPVTPLIQKYNEVLQER